MKVLRIRLGAHAARARRLIRLYEEIAAASRTMLLAARDGQWRDVEALRRTCMRLIVRVQRLAPGCRLDAAECRRRMELLRDILADDAEIRSLSEPRLRWVDQLLHVTPAAS